MLALREGAESAEQRLADLRRSIREGVRQ